jgi:hypothetical protein
MIEVSSKLDAIAYFSVPLLLEGHPPKPRQNFRYAGG